MSEPAKEMPNFDSFEEMMEWVEKSGTSKESKSSKGGSTKKKASSKSSSSKKQSSPKKKKKKPAKKDEAVEHDLAEADKGVADENIWSTIHFYKREGDSIESTRKDAKEEASFRNDNVLVFYHDHTFGEACESKCGGI